MGKLKIKINFIFYSVVNSDGGDGRRDGDGHGGRGRKSSREWCRRDGAAAADSAGDPRTPRAARAVGSIRPVAGNSQRGTATAHSTGAAEWEEHCRRGSRDRRDCTEEAAARTWCRVGGGGKLNG